MEEDFKFISTNGLNAVRIPVGWWIASDPTPPPPYVGGSLAALDNAFSWAQYVPLSYEASHVAFALFISIYREHDSALLSPLSSPLAHSMLNRQPKILSHHRAW